MPTHSFAQIFHFAYPVSTAFEVPSIVLEKDSVRDNGKKKIKESFEGLSVKVREILVAKLSFVNYCPLKVKLVFFRRFLKDFVIYNPGQF